MLFFGGKSYSRLPTQTTYIRAHYFPRATPLAFPQIIWGSSALIFSGLFVCFFKSQPTYMSVLTLPFVLINEVCGLPRSFSLYIPSSEQRPGSSHVMSFMSSLVSICSNLWFLCNPVSLQLSLYSSLCSLIAKALVRSVICKHFSLLEPFHSLGSLS